MFSRRVLSRFLSAFVFIALIGLLISARAEAESLLDKIVSGGSNSAPGQQIAPAPSPQSVPAAQTPGQASNSTSRPIKPGPGMTARVESAQPDSTAAAKGSSERASISPGMQSGAGWSVSAARTAGLENLKTALRKLNPHNPAHNSRIVHGATVFPAFCHDWEGKLEARQVNNLQHISWHQQDGGEMGTYTGYSPIQTCTTKLSTHGVLIGELTYREFTYALSGKTIEEARHARPKPVSITKTLEIFRWDRTKWLY